MGSVRSCNKEQKSLWIREQKTTATAFNLSERNAWYISEPVGSEQLAGMRGEGRDMAQLSIHVSSLGTIPALDGGHPCNEPILTESSKPCKSVSR